MTSLPQTPTTPPNGSTPGASEALGEPVVVKRWKGGTSGASLPATGTLLVGTHATIGAMHAWIGALDPVPVPTGALLADDAATLDGDSAGVPVLGRLAELPTLHARYRFRAALVCLPGAARQTRELAVRTLERLDIETRVIPAPDEFLGGHDGPPSASFSSGGVASTGLGWRVGAQIDFASLIGRTPHEIDRQGVSRVLGAKRVLITGAGGSIGSHLARVAAAFRPSQIILMDRAENALFEVDRQLERSRPEIARRAILHDVVEPEATKRLFEEIQPDVVLHAAAHKHVPLMEDHPAHAVTNNYFGTKAVLDAAIEAGAERFVMISSDKAVNPTSVMGATKRLAELYVQGRALEDSPTAMSMVRFGNVLGSACSVLTIWSSQIAEGGPVTVTDPRMTRYFMTIPEAAALVLQSTTLDPRGGSGVFVLDMGEPIPVLDLAERFVRAHGFEPEVCDAGEAESGEGVGADTPTMRIVFSGARPGEKIHEELAYDAENLEPTGHPGVLAWIRSDGAPTDGGALAKMTQDLGAVRLSSDRESVIKAIRRHVPELHERAD